MRLGGANEALLVDLITQERFPAAPGYARHAGQAGPGVGLDDPYAPPPGTGRRPHVHKTTDRGVVYVGTGPCEDCQAQLDGGR